MRIKLWIIYVVVIRLWWRLDFDMGGYKFLRSIIGEYLSGCGVIIWEIFCICCFEIDFGKVIFGGFNV